MFYHIILLLCIRLILIIIKPNTKQKSEIAAGEKLKHENKEI